MSRFMPEANCQICGHTAEVKKHLTFSFWWCPKCKDECSVWLKTVNTPFRQRGAYEIKHDDDIVISEPGVYCITDVNGSVEFYEQRPKSPDVRLNRAGVQSAKRFADSDLPSRIKVQSLSITRTGEVSKRQSLRAFSDAEDSPERLAQEYALAAKEHKKRLKAKALLDELQASGWIPTHPSYALPDLEKICERVQHGQVPPSDEL